MLRVENACLETSSGSADFCLIMTTQTDTERFRDRSITEVFQRSSSPVRAIKRIAQLAAAEQRVGIPLLFVMSLVSLLTFAVLVAGYKLLF